MENQAIRCLLVDDHKLVLRGINAHLGQVADVQVVAAVTDAAAALTAVSEHDIDVAVVDLSLPDMPGLQLIERLRAIQPRLKIVVLTMHDDEDYVLRAISLGIGAYVLKEQSADQLVAAIRAVHAGHSFFSPRITDYLVAHIAGKTTVAPTALPLTDREQQVLGGISAGQGSRQIAESLCLSVRTVQTYRERVMKKLDLHSVADLTRYAVAHGLVGAPLRAREITR